MTRFFTKDQYKYGLLTLWTIIMLFQASFTELMDDEAYYWVYSRQLDWGYFDHPPMIALMIKAGYAVIHSELGVRLLMIVMNVLTLLLTDKLIPQKHNTVFYLILGSMAALQLGGMLAVPDIPLIFFATLYFYCYRAFLQSQSWKNTLLLSLSMVLMFYSKYHGVLLVAFTVLSNLSLLRIYRFYIAVLITSALFFPHLYWQYTHDFPSVQYHLVERNAHTYHLAYTLDYLLGQLLIFGPLTGWLLAYYAFKVQVQDTFERALRFCLAGVLIFFMISTYKGHVEANWTVMIFAPLVILAHQGIVRHGWSLKPLKYTVPVTLFLVLVMRVYMVWDFMPGVRVRPELHHNREWTAKVASVAAGRPVVFHDSYQSPSKYMFYTGGLAYSVNSVFARRSQYNYWHTEEQLWGKPVLSSSANTAGGDSVITPQGKMYLDADTAFYAYSLIQFIPVETSLHAHPNDEITLSFGVRNGYDKPVPFGHQKPMIHYGFKKGDDWRRITPTELSLQDALGMDSIRIKVKVPEETGKYLLKITVSDQFTHNSPGIKVLVD